MRTWYISFVRLVDTLKVHTRVDKEGARQEKATLCNGDRRRVPHAAAGQGPRRADDPAGVAQI